jgi:tRNA/rRNA methyltransferase
MTMNEVMMMQETLARVRIVLVETSHPGNLGAVARAMKTMGLSDLVLVNPRCAVDAEALARASNAAEVLTGARIVTTLAEALADTVLSAACTSRRRDLPHPAYTPRQAAPRLLAQTVQGPVAIVFGSETYGLSNEQLALCRWLLNIPTNPDYASLNLGAAVQVVAYELRTTLADHALVLPEFAAATHAEIEGVLGALTEVLTERGFYNPERPQRLLPKLRRFFARAGLEKEEVAIWRGILANMRQPARKD